MFHAGAPGRGVGYAALPFFLMTLILLALPAAQSKEFGPFAKDRARRLLIPWLIWSAIYAAFKLLEVVWHHKPLGSEFSATMLLTGTSLHLWFLPFAYVVCLFLPFLIHLWPDTNGPFN